MTCDDAIESLRAFGTEQNRKVYTQHGVQEPMFGVSYANLGALKKRIKQNHELALSLWETGIHDARVLATMVADPTQVDRGLLDAWSEGLNNYVIADAVARLAASASSAREVAEAWTESSEEMVASCGWTVLSLRLMESDAIEDAELPRLIARIERGLPSSPNRVRHAMNNALIAIGLRSDVLAEQAIAAAGRIGRVKVDHGETGCKTPDARAYILKGRERAAARKKVGSREAESKQAKAPSVKKAKSGRGRGQSK